MPMEIGIHLSKAESPQTPEEISAMQSIPYQNLIGTLNHTAVMTRSDILKAVQSVAQFSSNPRMRHWNTALCIIINLNTMKAWALTLGSKIESKTPTFIAYSDADHANHLDHGYSISSYEILNVTQDSIGGVHAWCLMKQTLTALSTHKAEYIESVNTSHKVIWQCKLFLELRFVQKLRMCFFTNNNSALWMIDSPDQVINCTKHIHYNYHWIKEVAHKHIILLEHIPSEFNTADPFTKAFHAPQHKWLCRMLSIGPQNNACWRGVLRWNSIHTTHKHHVI